MNPVTWSAGVVTTEDDDALPSGHAPTSRPRRWPVLGGRVGVFIVGMAAWQLAAGNLVDTFYLPTPMGVLAELAGWIQDGSLLGHIAATLIPAVKGFMIAIVASLLLGYALASTRFIAQVLEPYIAALYGIPIIAVVPLMILWFGIGEGLAIAAAALASFFLMFYNVYFGIREVSQTLIDQVMIAGGSRWDIAVRVRLPSALVWVIAGMKVAVPHSIVGVVVAEFLTGNRGLGFLLSSNASQFNAAGTFAAVAVLATITFLLDRLMFVLTRRALLWKDAGRHHQASQ
jgi:NitT/TauT family transport system permease protein